MKIKVLLAGGMAALLAACATAPDAPEPVVEVEQETQTVAEPLTIRDKYEMIEYGQELDLVCSNPVYAEGDLSDRPNLQQMWENYLYDTPEGIWGEIGGMVEVNGNLPFDQGRWTNGCAIRVSHMLNKAGYKIPRQKDNKSVSGGVYDDGKKDQYIYRLRDLEAYLRATFGPPDEQWLDGSADSWDMPARPGIIVMDYPGETFNGHTTIWNGAGSVDNADIGGHKVYFWDLPCYIPEGRDQSIAVSTIESGNAGQ